MTEITSSGNKRVSAFSIKRSLIALTRCASRAQRQASECNKLTLTDELSGFYLACKQPIGEVGIGMRAQRLTQLTRPRWRTEVYFAQSR